MDFKELCLELARREGGKAEVNITQIRSIISHLRQLIKEDQSILSLLNDHPHSKQ